jgi:hypothetical protein
MANYPKLLLSTAKPLSNVFGNFIFERCCSWIPKLLQRIFISFDVVVVVVDVVVDVVVEA